MNATQPADTLIRNARVYTVDPNLPWTDAVAVVGDRIAWVGLDSEAGAHTGPGTRVIDAGRKMLLPGFIDTHNHVRLGSNPLEVNLAGAATLEEITERVRSWSDGRPDLAWIEGVGWNYSAMPGGRLPTWRDLEGVTGGKPAFLLSYDAHNVWMNREAMEIFGVTRGSGDLPFGHVQHDAGGEPTGFVTGFAVMGISRRGQAALEGVLPGYAHDQQYTRTLESLDMATQFGITTIVEPQNSPDDLWIYQRARDEGRLQSRLVAAMFHPVGTTDAERAEFVAARERFADDRLRVAPIKLYIDDVIEPWTAAMVEPYANRPGERGDTFWDPKEFGGLITELEQQGFQCHIHATGDRGIRTALDGIEAARQANGPGDRRHLMIHTECLTQEDIPRFAELGVIPGMQPRHCSPDIVADWRANVGEERWRYAWAFRSLQEAGATLAFSSDWNVAEMDPIIGIYSAITRATLDGSESWVPEERVDLASAIRAYTMGGAYACFAEDDRGSISPGKYADLALLSHDLFGCVKPDPRRVLAAKVEMTMVGGEVVHQG
ncbi:MAG: amidohydrolase [Actinomycetota bacterium]